MVATGKSKCIENKPILGTCILTVNHDVTGSSPVGGAIEIHYNLIGVDDAGGPPVPIPNTEVKPCSAENSWLETACENRKMPTQLKVSTQ